MRVALASLVALVAVGCGLAREEAASVPDANDPGVIVFTGLQGGGGGYYAMRPDGTEVRRLVFDEDEDLNLSADGRFIATIAHSFSGDDRIFVSRVDGSDRRRVPLPEGGILAASVSPGGRSLALVYTRDPFNGPWDPNTRGAHIPSRPSAQQHSGAGPVGQRLLPTWGDLS